MVREIPLCPNCPKPLESLKQITTTFYYWNKKKGKYEYDITDTGAFLCANCAGDANADVEELM